MSSHNLPPRPSRPPSPAEPPESVPRRGLLVPPDGAFPVASRHERVVNLLAEDAQGRYFVSLIIDREDWTELAVLLPADRWQEIAAYPVGARVGIAAFAAGDADARRPGKRRFGKRRSDDERAGRAVRSTQRSRWCSGPAPIPSVVAACRRELVRSHGSVGFVPLLREYRGTDPFLMRAAAALEAPARSVPGSSDRLAGLVGLGPGFTPAGDDFLSGVLLAEALLTGQRPAPPRAAAIGARLATTTPGGASLLRLALAGYPPRYQCRIATALGTEDVAGAIAIAAAHGHSSGRDFLAGLIWALDTDRPPEGRIPAEAV